MEALTIETFKPDKITAISVDDKCSGEFNLPFLCFSFICGPITTKLDMLVLWDKISQKP